MSQLYASSIKALFKDDVAEIVPYLLPGAVLVETIDTDRGLATRNERG